MASLQEIVDEIRAYVTSGCPAPSDAVRADADAYSVGCRETNERLRKCFDTLQRGMRSDAIHLAEAPPNLLDQVAMLDFPELAGWKQACQVHRMTAPPELLIELGSALNDAYAAEQPLATLLASHRIMAMAGAPLEERLTVMRRIAQLDTTGRFWDEDIKVFEIARLDEIKQQLGKAVKAADTAAVTRLRDEAHKPTWRVAVPEDLRRLLQDAAARLESAKTIQALRDALPALTDAYGALAYEECLTLLDKWGTLAATIKPNVPPELQGQVDHIATWVREEHGRRRRVIAVEQAGRELQRVLDADQPTPACQDAYHALVSLGSDVPQELEDRYRRLLADRASAAARSRRNKTLGVIAVLLVVVAGGAVVAYWYDRSSKVEQAKVALDQAIKDVREGDEAKGTFEKEDLISRQPWLAKQPSVAAGLFDFDAAVKQEQNRKRDVMQDIADAKGEPDTNLAAKRLDDARSKALTKAEREQIDLKIEDLRSNQAERQKEADKQLVEACEQIVAHLNKLDLDSISPEEYRRQVESGRTQAKVLLEKKAAKRETRDLESGRLDHAFEQADDVLKGNANRKQRLDDVAKSGSDLDKHERSLRRFVEECGGDDPRTSDFKKEVGRIAKERAVQTWSDLTKTWGPTVVPSNYDDLNRRLKQVAKYTDETPGSPVADAAKAYRKQLESAAALLDPQAEWRKTLDGILTKPFIGNCEYLETKEGDRYYVAPGTKVASKPKGSGILYTFDALTGSDDSSKKSVSVTTLSFQPARKSPQSTLAEGLHVELENLNGVNSIDLGSAIVRRLKDQPDLNVFLRIDLLNALLGLDIWGSDTAIDDERAKLKQLPAQSWFDPMELKSATDQSRKDAEAAFRRAVVTVEAVHTRLTAGRATASKAAMLIVVGEGVLIRDKDLPNIDCDFPLVAGQTALVLGPDDKLLRVATVEGGKWSFDPSRTSTVLDGSLVFVTSGP